MFSRAHRGLWVPQRFREPNYSADDGYSPPPGKDVPAHVRRTWQEAFDKAHTYYVSQRAPDPKTIASNTAWKTIELQYGRKSNRQRVEVGKTRKGKPVYLGSRSHKAPELPKTPRLGKVIEIAWLDASNGEPYLHVQRFKEPGLPDLMWDDDKKILLFFPTSNPPQGIQSTDLRGLEKQAKVFRRWAKGRKPKGFARISTPDNVMVAPVGVADTIVYRSDKFSGKHNPHPDLRGSQEYVHQFDDDVFVEQAKSNFNVRPEVVNILGGRLDVEPGGIVH